jgi:polyphosphate kinase
MQHFLAALPYPRRNRQIVVGADPLIVGSSSLVIGAAENILETTLHPANRRKG